MKSWKYIKYIFLFNLYIKHYVYRFLFIYYPYFLEGKAESIDLHLLRSEYNTCFILIRFRNSFKINISSVFCLCTSTKYRLSSIRLSYNCQYIWRYLRKKSQILTRTQSEVTVLKLLFEEPSIRKHSFCWDPWVF